MAHLDLFLLSIVGVLFLLCLVVVGGVQSITQRFNEILLTTFAITYDQYYERVCLVVVLVGVLVDLFVVVFLT